MNLLREKSIGGGVRIKYLSAPAQQRRREGRRERKIRNGTKKANGTER
jgi:hypothetical protein